MKHVIRNALIGIFVLIVASVADAATYTYTGPNYPAGSITGGSFTTSMHMSGFFTTAAPLPPSSTTQLGTVATSWDFFDGVNHFTNLNSIQLYNDPTLFAVTTDASGNITSYSIGFQSPLPPNTVGQAMNQIFITQAQRQDYIGATCVSLAGTICNNASTSANGVNDFTAGGVWSIAGAAPVPTMPTWAMALMALLLAASAFAFLGRQRQR